MTEETHVLELLPAYALDGLDEAEKRQVDEHLTGCYLCRTELRAYQDVTGQLAFLAPEALPSPDLQSRLVDRIQRVKLRRPFSSYQPSVSPPLFRRLMPVGAIMGLVLIVALALSNLLLWQRLNHLDVLAGPLGMRAVTLQNTQAAPQASAFVIISSDGDNGVLVVDELPELEAAREYQLWLVRGEETISGAVFSVDETGYRGLRIEAPDSLLNYSAVRVTVEPQGGSLQPEGVEVLNGSLFNP
jgi:anti-sigma-K factor RskA